MDSQKNQDIIRNRVSILLNLDEFEKYKDKIENRLSFPFT